jgi:hypothetical protein
VIALDPISGESCTISSEADSERLSRINLLLWGRLDGIRRSCTTGGAALSAVAGGRLLQEIHEAGMTALMVLIGSRDAVATKYNIFAFFKARIPTILDAGSRPPIIELASYGEHHFPIEVLPLLGKSANSEGNGTKESNRRIAETLPGYCAVVRRRELMTEAERQVTPQPADGPLSVCLFRHDELVGVRREIRKLGELERTGRLVLTRIFPPHGHQPPERRPELELVAVVADPQIKADDSRQPRRGLLDRVFRAWRPLESSRAPADQADVMLEPHVGRIPSQAIRGHVCHFSCHLYDKHGRSYLEMMPNGAVPRTARYYLDAVAAAIGDLPAIPSNVSVLFLGTCRSGVKDQTTRTSAIDVFQFFRPSCLIGTLADVHDEAAAEFCLEFYREFSTGSCVGVSLRCARLRLLDEWFNPFGLLFTSYFGEDLHVRMPADRRSNYVPDESEGLTAPEFA